jgi:hypothetical protein
MALNWCGCRAAVKIHNAADSRRLAAANDRGIGAIHIPINIDATGADAAGLAASMANCSSCAANFPA